MGTLALRGCAVIAMAPEKLNQFLAVNSRKSWIAVSAVILAMTTALASATPQPHYAGTDPWAGGDTFGNCTPADARGE